MRRSPACLRATALVGFLAAACGGRDSTEPGGGVGSRSGVIQGVVQATTDGRGISDAFATLRKTTGDSIASSLSDSTGRFAFTGIPAGGYRVSTRLPSGYSATTREDTLQAVTVTDGGTTPVTIRGTPIAAGGLLPRVGVPETLTVAAGQVIVTLPVGAPAISIQAALASGTDAAWGSPIAGIPLDLTLSPGSAHASIAAPQHSVNSRPVPLTISLPLPNGALAASSSAHVLGLWTTTRGTSLSRYTAPIITLTDPATGASRRVVTLSVPYFGNAPLHVRLAAAPVPLACGRNISLTPVADGGTGPEPLVLIHGIDVKRDMCYEYDSFSPATTVFGELIAALRRSPEIRRQFTIYVFKYPTYAGVKNAADGLFARVTPLLSTAHPQFAVVAHSMGGLVIRQYLEDRGIAGVDQVITLATPHQGTPFADASFADLTSTTVQNCYERHAADLGPGRLLVPWEDLWWKLFGGVIVPGLGIQYASLGVQDLKTTSRLAKNPESSGARFTLLAGMTELNSVDHGDDEANSALTLTGCYFEDVLGITAHDESVPFAKTQPKNWTGPGTQRFRRDHLEMEGVDNARDDLQASIINTLILPHAGPAPQIQVLSGDNQTAPAGQPLPAPITVRATTAAGLPLPNVALAVTISTGGGVASPTLLSTDSQGRASFAWTLGPSGGVQRVNVTIGGFAGATVPVFAVTTGGNSCPRLTPYALGATVSASLLATDCFVNRPPSPETFYYRGYTSPVPASRAVQLTMTSTAFAPRIDVGVEPSGNWSLGFAPAAGNPQTSYKALLPLGPFLIRAGSVEGGRTGPFSFTAVAASADVSNCEDAILASGVATVQQLVATDCGTAARRFDRYLVPLPPGWTLLVTMASNTLDAYLELFAGNDQTLLTFDDDGGTGTDSRLSYTSTQNVALYLHATSFSGAALGGYTLTFALLPPVGGSPLASAPAAHPEAPGALARPQTPP